MVDPQVRALAGRIRALERQLLALKQPSLAYSAIDGGALQANDDDGNLTMVIGVQHDGTNTAAPVTGPTPPQPTLPLVTSTPGGLRVYWDGTFKDGAVAPMDFARVTAYAVPSSVYTGPDPLDQTVIVGSFTSATGGEVTAGLDSGEHTVYLVCWSQAGKFGPASEVALGTPSAVLEELATKNSIHRGTAPPWENGDTGHPDDIGDMWIDESLGPGSLHDVTRRKVASGVATLRTADASPDLVEGKTVLVTGVDVALDGSWVITAATEATFSYAVPDVPDMAEADVLAGTAQGQDVQPSNLPHIWDGANWIAVRDSGAEAAATLRDHVVDNKQAVAAVSITAADAYNTAYAADGRVAISDYEPGPDDVEGKNDGSLWITRTRERANLAVNPAFSMSTDFWSIANASTMTRVAVTATDVGPWAARVTNDATTTATHDAHLTGHLPVTAGQEFIASGFMRLAAQGEGVPLDNASKGVGHHAFISWYDSGGNLIARTAGPTIDLLAPTAESEGWKRAYVTAKAPDTLPADSTARIGFSSPGSQTDAVWELQGVLIESGTRLGRYFDGDSEGGTWDGTDGLSSSKLDGGAIIRLFNLEDGSWAEKFWTADTISSVDVKDLRIDRDYVRPSALGKMFDGAMIGDRTVAQDKLYVPAMAADEALFAGALVYVVNKGGAPVLRLARADTVGAHATGYVLQAAAVGVAVPVYTSGYNALQTDLTPGPQFLSTTPGRAASVSPSAVGSIIQRVGDAVSATTLNFAAQPSVAIT